MTGPDLHPTISPIAGKRSVRAAPVGAFMVAFVLYTGLLLYATMAFWPPALAADLPANAPPPDSSATFFGTTYVMTRDQNLLLLVAILGSLGAMAHVMRSFAMYVGQKRLHWSWVGLYVTTPFMGAVLATIAYILLRAGLVGGTGSQEGSTWGFAAIATLVGLFNAQATSKLKEIFEVILAPAKSHGDGLDPVASQHGTDGTVPTQPASGSAPAARATNGSSDGDSAPALAPIPPTGAAGSMGAPVPTGVAAIGDTGAPSNAITDAETDSNG